MDADEQKLFAAALRRAVETGQALDEALEQVGWVDAVAGDPRTATSTLFELQGEYGATSTALDTVVTTALGLPPGRVVLPAIGGQAAPGTVDRDRVRVRGLCRGPVPDTLVVVAAAGDGYVAATSDTLDLTPVAAMDPGLELVEVTGDVPLTAAVPIDWPAGVAAAQQALAYELVGTSRTMLRLAREHALHREQFGRPIGSFQAVRHRLAEALVAVEAAQAAAATPAGDPRSARLAKAVAGRSAHIVARHAQQVLAGIGFTTEHPLHRYVRRALVLDGLFGSSRTLAREIGAEALLTRRLPRPVPL